MLTCTICGLTFRPPWSSLMSEEDAVCVPCFDANLSGERHEETRRHGDAGTRGQAQTPDPLAVSPRPGVPASSSRVLTLTPRQVEAMRRVVEGWSRT